jgi:hypothetical protein
LPNAENVTRQSRPGLLYCYLTGRNRFLNSPLHEQEALTPGILDELLEVLAAFSARVSPPSKNDGRAGWGEMGETDGRCRAGRKVSGYIEKREWIDTVCKGTVALATRRIENHDGSRRSS